MTRGWRCFESIPLVIILFGNYISSEQDEMKKVEKMLRRGSATLDSRQSPN